MRTTDCEVMASLARLDAASDDEDEDVKFRVQGLGFRV